MGENRGGEIISTNLHQFSHIRFVEMSVDLWTMGNVAIHLRQGYGGQDVKVLPVPIFNVEWERVVGHLLEQCAVCHELRKVFVDDAISFLDRVIAREDVFRIVVPYFAQWCVFTVFRFPACRHRHTSLDV